MTDEQENKQNTSDVSTQDASVNFEKALSELEQVVKDLEQGDLTLDESLEKFQKGIELSKICNKQLSEAEKRIEKLTRDEETRELKTEAVNFEEE